MATSSLAIKSLRGSCLYASLMLFRASTAAREQVVLAVNETVFRSLVASWRRYAMPSRSVRRLLQRYSVAVPHTLVWLARTKD